MVTFVSLFLWLMTGDQPVRVAVDPTVASVEIFLDGQSVGVATDPEWQVTVDFGQRLRPHELVAIARDDSGREVDREIQVINLPRPEAEVELVFEEGTPEAPTMLRVITVSAERLAPLAVFVTFDGVMLPKESDGRFRLPPYDRRQMHLVSAEAYYPDGITARRDVTFGGAWGGGVATELTAVPVTVDKRRELSAGDLAGLLRARGEILSVAAVDRPGGRVYFVRDHSAWPALRRIGSQLDRRRHTTRMRFNKFLSKMAQGPGAISEIPPEQERFYLIVPNPAFSRGLALYPILEPFNIDRWGLTWLATHIASSEAAIPGQRLPDAVAVAALRAAGDGCPRAVVLLLGGDGVGAGNYAAAAVREYLRTLKVPFYVWKVAGEPITPWGRAEIVDSTHSLSGASKRLLKDLRRQWIVWVEGLHLPNEIEIDDNRFGIRLAN
ncbi:MAG: hypothetical protein P8127_08765 [Acidobacteriota bacterium]